MEVARIEKSLGKGNNFRDLVFSKSEIEYCSGKSKENFAGRFAAKEAFLKAVGSGWRGEVNLNELEFLNDDSGKPYLNISGKTEILLSAYKNSTIHVSISHTKTYATAMVIIEEIQ